MNKFKYLLIFFCFFHMVGFAQFEDFNIEMPNETYYTIYTELGGTGLGLVTMNFEYGKQIKRNVGIGVGIGAGPSFFTNADTLMMFSFPIQANMLYGSTRNKLELGIGTPLLYDDVQKRLITEMVALRIGYRRQPLQGGYFFRASLMGFPNYIFRILPFVGFAWGFTF